MDREGQLRELFGEKGMNVKTIRHNDSLEYYHVNIGVEGTDEEFLEDVKALGSSEPVDSKVDAGGLEAARDRIHGAEIDAGTVAVTKMMGGAHFQIEVR